MRIPGFLQRRVAGVPLRSLSVAMLALWAGVLPLAGQSDTADLLPRTDPDTAGLATGPFSAMEMLYEATIFNVDVFTLRIRLDDGTRDRLQATARERDWSDALEDEMAQAVMEARDALVSSVFHRDVGLDRFLDGMGDNIRKAREAGLITREEEARILADSGEQFAPLRERGIREGDTFRYRVRGDSLRVVFQDRDGSPLGSAVRVGPERRISLLASYMAPGSEFREKLLRPLVESQGR